jgi:hypothetical protein
VLAGSRVVSVSIDATIRQWYPSPTELQLTREASKDSNTIGEQLKHQSILTEEEERELAGLMEDDS